MGCKGIPVTLISCFGGQHNNGSTGASSTGKSWKHWIAECLLKQRQILLGSSNIQWQQIEFFKKHWQASQAFLEGPMLCRPSLEGNIQALFYTRYFEINIYRMHIQLLIGNISFNLYGYEYTLNFLFFGIFFIMHYLTILSFLTSFLLSFYCYKIKKIGRTFIFS